MSGTLEGTRAVLFGEDVSVPLAGMLLADQGAEVVHVQPSGGVRRPLAAHGTWGRGQRRTELDLQTPHGLRAASELIQGADALIENFRPGVMARLGLDADTVRAANPGLVYCALPGFSASDAERADLPGWEGLIQAATAATHPWFEGATGLEPPVFNALPVASVFAAFHAVTAISAALLERDGSGQGQVVEVSLYAAMYSALGSLGMRIHNIHSGPNQVINFVPLVRQYECADRRWVQLHAFTRRSLRQFARVAGVESWIAEGVLRIGPVISDPNTRAVLQARLETLFRTRTAQVWEDALSAAGVSAAVCRTTSEWFAHPQTRAGGLRTDQPGEASRLPGAQVEFSGTPSAVGTDPAANVRELATVDWQPRPGAVLNEVATTPILDGVRVLDLCIVLAGTTCGRTLAEYGADVVKIDDPNRDGGVIFHNDVNRGKRSLVLDLKTGTGKEVFWRMVERADVVVENFRAGVVERLGIGYSEVRKRRPDIVYVSLNTYGYRGPWSDRPGWEQLAEAASGMQVRYGGGGRPVLQPYAVLDFGTGLMAAYGAIAALRHRRRTGVGQHVTTSLIATAGTLQSALVPGPETDLLGGPGFRGGVWFHRFYRARDRWFFLAAEQHQSGVICEAIGLPGAGVTDAESCQALDAALGDADAATWIARLRERGVAALPVRSIAEVMSDRWAMSQGISLRREHPGIGLVDTVGPVPLLSRTPLRPGRPATLPGIDGRELLLECGLAPSEVEELLTSGVVAVPRGAGS